MKLKWVIQNNLGRSNDVHKLVDLLDVLKVKWEHIPYIPFDLSPITNVDESGITLFYGSTGLVRKVRESGSWKPGVFFEPTRFNFQSVLAGFGSNLLNADSEVVTVGELLKRNYSDREVFFTRPTEDSKLFNGEVLYFDEIKQWEHRVAEPQDRMTSDTLVQLSKPKMIKMELRSFVVNGRVSTSSYYAHGKRNHTVEADDEAFAQEMASIYQPAEVFTLDTCQLEDGTRKVVEANCFNCSGLYNSDIHKLIGDVNNYLLERFS